MAILNKIAQAINQLLINFNIEVDDCEDMMNAGWVIGALLLVVFKLCQNLLAFLKFKHKYGYIFRYEQVIELHKGEFEE